MTARDFVWSALAAIRPEWPQTVFLQPCTRSYENLGTENLGAAILNIASTYICVCEQLPNLGGRKR